MPNLSTEQLNIIFDKQVETLLTTFYSSESKKVKEDLLNQILPLKEQLSKLEVSEVNIENGYLPFVIVLIEELIDLEKAMSLTNKNGKSGVTILRPHSIKDFKNIEEVSIPKAKAYLLVNIDRGASSINLPPNEALKQIRLQKRSPLTISEGIAIITHYPEFLIKNNCFSLLASRTGKDQRVPAIWINSKKEPNLGWCWDGNPHTWLGSASAAERIGVT